MSNWEKAECVKINMDNLAKMNPEVKAHPMFVIAYEQLQDLCKSLEAE